MRLTVTVPTEADQDEAIKDSVTYDMALLFGGATVTYGHGAWLDRNNKLVYNRVHVIESFNMIVSKDEAMEALYGIAMDAMFDSGEDTIMYTIDNNAYFTERD